LGADSADAYSHIQLHAVTNELTCIVSPPTALSYANPNTRSCIQVSMSQPIRSNNDPTPEARKSDSSFLPVVIAFAVSILVILVIAIIFIKSRQTKAIPNPHESHPTSQLIQPVPAFNLPYTYTVQLS
jgi:hypothetical protein